jgi:hypothetical protein
MTPRMAYYLTVLAQGETVTAGILLFIGGMAALWCVLKFSPWPFLRRLSGAPFWIYALVLFLLLLAGLLLMKDTLL